MATIIAEIQMVIQKGPGVTLVIINEHGIIVISVSARNGQNYYFNDLHSLIFFNCHKYRPKIVQRFMCNRQRRILQWSNIKDCIRLYLSTMGLVNYGMGTCTKSHTRPSRKEFLFCLIKIYDDIVLRNSSKTIIIVEILTAMIMALGATPLIQK